MEYVVETSVPTTAPGRVLEGLFDRLDLTGDAAEILFGEANEDTGYVHVLFQINARNERQASFRVMQAMSPVLHELTYETAASARYSVRTTDHYDREQKRSRMRWCSSQLVPALVIGPVGVGILGMLIPLGLYLS